MKQIETGQRWARAKMGKGKGILWRCREIFLSGISFTSRVNRPARAPILAALVARITTEFWVKLFLSGVQNLETLRPYDPISLSELRVRLREREKSVHAWLLCEGTNQLHLPDLPVLHIHLLHTGTVWNTLWRNKVTWSAESIESITAFQVNCRMPH